MIPEMQTVEQVIQEDKIVAITFPDDADVTGYSFTFVIASTLDAAFKLTSDLSVSKTVGAGITIVDGQNITVDLTGGPSANLVAGECWFACRRTGSPNRTVAAWGPWIVVG